MVSSACSWSLQEDFPDWVDIPLHTLIQVDFIILNPNSDFLLLRFCPLLMLCSYLASFHNKQFNSEASMTPLAVFLILLWYFPCYFLIVCASLSFPQSGSNEKVENHCLARCFHLFNRHLLGAYTMPDTILGAVMEQCSG